jgi:tagatose 6-phosphate kinase
VIAVTGLTPAWQFILEFDDFRLGEVNRAAQITRCGSGKVLNVGLALTALGTAARTICPLGGPARRPIAAEFAALKVDVDWIDTASPTRVCTTLLDRRDGTTTELVENAGPLSAGELRSYCDAYAATAATSSIAVFTGSLPTGVDPSFYRQLADLTPGRIIADVRGEELLLLLDGPKKPLLVKPNREELAKTVGHAIDGDDGLIAAMREVNERGAAWVVVSQGKNALWASSKTDGVYKFTPPRPEQVVNPIGCGDCLCAGIAATLADGGEVLQAIKFGMAAAADNLRSLLPARLERAKVEALAATVECVRIA